MDYIKTKAGQVLTWKHTKLTQSAILAMSRKANDFTEHKKS